MSQDLQPHKSRGSRSLRTDSSDGGAALRLLGLDRRSLRDRARVAIRASIATGELGEDQIYPVAYFGARLGVSATPIREALFDLAGEGLVEVVRNRGFRVPRLSERDLDELYDLRLMLEVPAMRRLATRPEQLEVQRLRQLARAMVDQARRKDVADFLWTDRSFHLAVMEGLGNRQLVEMVARLRDRTRLAGITGMAESGVLVETAREHLELLEAFAARDGRRAEQWMRRHLSHTRGLWAGRNEEGLGPSLVRVAASR